MKGGGGTDNGEKIFNLKIKFSSPSTNHHQHFFSHVPPPSFLSSFHPTTHTKKKKKNIASYRSNPSFFFSSFLQK
jgi:hypothetical protein